MWTWIIYSLRTSFMELTSRSRIQGVRGSNPGKRSLKSFSRRINTLTLKIRHVKQTKFKWAYLYFYCKSRPGKIRLFLTLTERRSPQTSERDGWQRGRSAAPWCPLRSKETKNIHFFKRPQCYTWCICTKTGQLCKFVSPDQVKSLTVQLGVQFAQVRGDSGDEDLHCSISWTDLEASLIGQHGQHWGEELNTVLGTLYSCKADKHLVTSFG